MLKPEEINIKNKPANKYALRWVYKMAVMCKPNKIQWLNGSKEEEKELIEDALKSGDLIKLDQKKMPGCYLHRSAHNDVARAEQLTFICSKKKEDAGPTNNWMAPTAAYKKLEKIFNGAMKGRTMYVVPFLMGPQGSKFCKVGVELTDSLYVALNMGKMTRMGNGAWKELDQSNDFTKCLHSKAELDDKKRFICHFPQDNTVWSVGSGYGGNALLGKKCLALRIASYLGKKEGWLAEHMLIMGVKHGKGETHYVAAAFPSACGKTNLAMLTPPKTMTGWKIWTVGDDIAWMHVGKDGSLRAVNPEAGFFGVVPGTSSKTNPKAMQTMQKNTIFTNVVYKDDGTVWWEGCDEKAPKKATNWKGEIWDSGSGEKGAHPNSRFTASVSGCPSISPEWDNPKGVPISAIIFGGRRAKVAPLVYESFNWQHGTFVGSTMASEKTAAAEGTVGEVRYDPMAMIPFCGYHMGDYFQHWLKMGKIIKKKPKIFHVNWFRMGKDGKFLWPGYGENLRVIKWIIERATGKVGAKETAIGLTPLAKDLHLKGLSVGTDNIERLLNIEKADWEEEVKKQEEFLKKFGKKLPKEISLEHQKLQERLVRN
jgi:phosphoenolpyruvate carboxykinase (GTP)